MHKFKTVFAFEYSSFIKSKAYIVVSIILLVLTAGAGSLPAIMKGVDAIKTAVTGDAESKEETLKEAVLIDPQGVYDDAVLQAFLPGYAWTRQDTAADLAARIESGEVSLGLVIDGLDGKLYIKGEDAMGGGFGGVHGMVSFVYRQNTLMGHGLTEADIAALEVLPSIETIPIGKDITQTFWLAYVILFLLYMTTLMYGQNVLMSVVTEKSSKAMELLVTSAKSTELMFGKVMGVGAVGLSQFGLMMLAVGLSIRLNLEGWMEMSPMVGEIMSMSLSGGLFAYAVIFFLLGFFSFAFVYAGVGSTVSRMEEAGAVQSVPMLIFVAAFFVAMAGMVAPGSMWVRVLSYVPFFSPMVMFMRICVTDMPGWEIALGIVLNVLYMMGAGIVAARIYRVGVLMYGKAPKFIDIIKYILPAPKA